MEARGAMRWSAALLLGFGVLSAASGCRNCDLVEAELRTRDSDLRELKSDLYQAQLRNEALIRELSAVRQTAPALISPEQAAQIYTLKQVTLGRQTGGYDEDHAPGDEALQVVLEPRDIDGHVIKAPGSLHVEALEITPEGLKTPPSSWDLSPDQVRRTWRSGLWTTGYFIVLAWKNWPTMERLRVVVRFTLADGRVFEADKDVTVHLAPPALRKQAPANPSPEIPGPVFPDPQSTLSTPRRLDLKPGATSGTSSPASGISVQTTTMWRPKSTPSLADSVQLLRPEALERPPADPLGP